MATRYNIPNRGCRRHNPSKKQNSGAKRPGCFCSSNRLVYYPLPISLRKLTWAANALRIVGYSMYSNWYSLAHLFYYFTNGRIVNMKILEKVVFDLEIETPTNQLIILSLVAKLAVVLIWCAANSSGSLTGFPYRLRETGHLLWYGPAGKQY